MSDRLLDLQHAIKSFLDSKEFFSNSRAVTPVPIPVVTEDTADVESTVNQAVAQMSGLCVLVRVPGGRIPSGDHATPVYEPAMVHIRVYENPTTNRAIGGTYQPACKVGDAIVRLLYGRTMEGFNDPLVPKSRAWGTDEDVPFYDIVFEVTVPLDPDEPTRDESCLAEDGQPLLSNDGTPIITNP
jgi:hypothetical protein